jgi:hypothetical protein
MPLLLLIPLLVLAIVALWALLLPVSLWARYRAGRARRRAQGWVIRANAWLLAASVLVFLGTAALTAPWVPGAWRDAGLGLLAGIGAGVVSLWLTRFEHDADGFFFTPNRWLVLGLTGLVAARIVAGLWAGWERVGGHADSPATWAHAGGWLGVGGVLLGYCLAYTWGLRARLRRRVTA